MKFIKTIAFASLLLGGTAMATGNATDPITIETVNQQVQAQQATLDDHEARITTLEQDNVVVQTKVTQGAIGQAAPNVLNSEPEQAPPVDPNDIHENNNHATVEAILTP